VKVLLTLTDVEPAVRLNAALEKDGADTAVVSPMDDVRGAIRREKPNVIVITGALLDPQHVQLVRSLLWDEVPVVGLADVLDPDLTARLKEIGYVEVHAKPIQYTEVSGSVRRVIERRQLQEDTGLSGESEAIREVLVKVEQMAPVSSTVLIEGESGTGKELVARAIHKLSPRRNKPFIAVNVGALPETLLESELFGHEKGAFTGAAERRIGRFELAHNGTLFLDEIGDVPMATQVKLLRALEEREITRVGGTQSIAVDVRVVAATNAPLAEQVKMGTFRSDLFYRLDVLHIYLPPLRERREDIPLLVRRFVRELSERHDRPFQGIAREALDLLVEYPWPGNVRELRNLIESMVVLAPGREITAGDIPRQIRDGSGARFLPVHVGPVLRGEAQATGRELEFIIRSLVELKLQVEELRRHVHELDDRRDRGWLGEVQEAQALPSPSPGIEPQDQAPPPNVVTISPRMTMAEIERAAIEAALRESQGNRRKAAEMLQIGERTLYRKLREYQLPVGDLMPD
ncbi:MAG TPA: sigma-54 dependent transcriptional regulator, partial [Gemmatimonadaceae bacterium]|nr:sigma-54 dependent transcriptional regulator [Gemmatimonadaceae bacterium]